MTRSEAGQPKYLSISSAVPDGFFTSRIKNLTKDSSVELGILDYKTE